MRLLSFILSIVATVAVLVTITDVQTGMRGLFAWSDNSPQHRTVSVTPKEEKGFVARSLDTLAATLGIEREQPKSQLQQLMDRRRKEIEKENRAIRFP